MPVRPSRLALLPLAIATAAPAAGAQVTINTFPPEYGYQVQLSQTRNQDNVGETFVVPLGNAYLSTLTVATRTTPFGIPVVNPTDQARLRLFIYAWNGTRVTGAPLYQSGVFSPAGTDFVEHTFAPGLTLTPGATYAFFLSGLGLTQPTDLAQFDIAQRGTSNADLYVPGIRVNADETSFGVLTTGTWFQSPDRDIAFRAAFTGAAVLATPEPATAALVAMGLLAVGAVARRRRRATV